MLSHFWNSILRKCVTASPRPRPTFSHSRLFIMASQTWQKWYEFKITYRVSVINVWDWEITMWDWKITTWDWKITVIVIREWKTVMRDHNYQWRTKNYHTRFTVTVENEKSLCEKKNHHSKISISFFFEPISLSIVSTTNYGPMKFRDIPRFGGTTKGNSHI